MMWPCKLHRKFDLENSCLLDDDEQASVVPALFMLAAIECERKKCRSHAIRVKIKLGG